MFRLCPNGGHGVPYLSAFLLFLPFLFLSIIPAHCVELPPEDDDLHRLSETFFGAVPVSLNWIGVTRLPPEGFLEPPVTSISPLLAEMSAGIDPKSSHEEVSFAAFDMSGKALGYIKGRVADESAFLDSINHRSQSNRDAITAKLLTAWLSELEERGVTSIRTNTLASDIKRVNRFQELGFNAEEAFAIHDEGKSGAETKYLIRWAVPLSYENEKDSYTLDRIGELRDLLIPQALKALAEKGVTPMTTDLEVVVASEADKGLLQKAQDFVDKCPNQLNPLILDMMPPSTVTFIAKTNEPNSRVVGLATARLQDDGTMVVPWFYVGEHAEGYASLLLAEAVRAKAWESRARQSVMFIPLTAVGAWRSAMMAEFTVRAMGAELTYGLCHPNKGFRCHTNSDYKVRQQLEYRLTVLRAQVAGTSEQVKGLSTSGKFCRHFEAFHHLFKPEIPRPSPPKIGDKKKPVQVWDKIGILEASSLGVLMLLLVWAIYDTTLKKRLKPKAIGPQAAAETWKGPVVAKWEWQAAPERRDDGRSSELDEFVITTNDSESSVQASVSVP